MGQFRRSHVIHGAHYGTAHIQLFHEFRQALHGLQLRGQQQIGQMQLQLHPLALPAHGLQLADGLADPAEGYALTAGIAGLVGTSQRKGHHVHAAVHDGRGQLLIHALAAGGGGHSTACPPRHAHKIQKAGMQQRFAPALQVHAGTLAHERPERGKGLVAHEARLPDRLFHGLRAVGAATAADRGNLHLHAEQRRFAAKKGFTQPLAQPRPGQSPGIQGIMRAHAFLPSPSQ